MLILLSVIFVGLTVIFLKIISDNDLSIIGVTLFGICSFICIIAMLIVGGNLVSGNVIQDKIEMYESENAKIDSQICEIVESYKSYEKETFEKISNKNANVLIELYPDLKTNELVQKQIKVYMDNKKKVVSLQEDLINQKPLRWWLYFGE